LVPGEINFSNRMQYTDLYPDRRTHSLFSSFSQRFGDDMELFAEARGSQRETEQRYAAPEALFIVPNTNPFFVDLFGNSPAVAVGYDFINELGQITSEGGTRTFVGSLGLRNGFGESWKSTAAIT
jgi:hypothetical protein